MKQAQSDTTHRCGSLSPADGGLTVAPPHASTNRSIRGSTPSSAESGRPLRGHGRGRPWWLLRAIWFVVALPFRLLFLDDRLAGADHRAGDGVRSSWSWASALLRRPPVPHRHPPVPHRAGVDAAVPGISFLCSVCRVPYVNCVLTEHGTRKTEHYGPHLPRPQRDDADGPRGPGGDAAVFPGGGQRREPARVWAGRPGGPGRTPGRRWRGSSGPTRPR